jgi:RimJ/RimL family protein N-acetyltransferase
MPHTPANWVEPLTLEGRVVRLEPLGPQHAAGLALHAEKEIFKYHVIMPATQTPEAALAYIATYLARPHSLGFAIVLRESAQAIGATSYMDIREEHKGLEIGSTWLSRQWRGTAVNPECKLLLLKHAFEELHAERVQLKTDGRNLQSQGAIEKLGAVKEGVLRKHLMMPDGYLRDTVMYSIIRSEWPAVKERLMARLAMLSA